MGHFTTSSLEIKFYLLFCMHNHLSGAWGNVSPYALYFLNLYDIFIVFQFIVTSRIKLFILGLWFIKYLFMVDTRDIFKGNEKDKQSTVVRQKVEIEDISWLLTICNIAGINNGLTFGRGGVLSNQSARETCPHHILRISEGESCWESLHFW